MSTDVLLDEMLNSCLNIVNEFSVFFPSRVPRRGEINVETIDQTTWPIHCTDFSCLIGIARRKHRRDRCELDRWPRTAEKGKCHLVRIRLQTSKSTA